MELAFLLDFVAPVALLIAPPIVMARLLAPGTPEALSTLFAIPLDPPHPRRVQEEEPVRWRVERLRPRQPETGRAEQHRQVVALDLTAASDDCR